MSSTHRVLTATLCTDSKRERISLHSLDQRPLKLLKNGNRLPTGPSKPLLYHLDSPLTSAGDRRLRRQCRSQGSQPGQASMRGCSPGQIHETAPLDAGFLGSRRENTDDVLASSAPSPVLVGPADNTPRLDSADLGSDAGGVLGVELRPGHDTGHARSSAVLGHRLSPGLEAPRAGILSSTSAKGTGAADGSMACRTPSKAPRSLLLPALRNVHATVGRTGGARLPAYHIPSIKGIAGASGKWSLLIRARELEQPGKTGEYDNSVSLDLARHQFLFPVLQVHKATRGAQPTREWPKRWKTHSSNSVVSDHESRHMPFDTGGSSEDRAVNARSLEEVYKRGGWKSFTSVRRHEKHARLSLLMAKIPIRLLQQGPALENDLGRLWTKH